MAKKIYTETEINLYWAELYGAVMQKNIKKTVKYSMILNKIIKSQDIKY